MLKRFRHNKTCQMPGSLLAPSLVRTGSGIPGSAAVTRTGAARWGVGI
jgi:hypothetical protein